MKTMIIVNPCAREGEVGKKWPQLEHELLGALGEGEAVVEFTSAKDHGSGVVRKALQAGIERLLIVGGDGTVSEVAQAFLEKGKPISSVATLMIMPAGRGDDFFKSVVGRRCTSAADAWDQGLALMKHGKPEPTDVGGLAWIPATGGRQGFDRAFVNVASFGYPGLVVQKVHANAGMWGRSRVGKSAWAYVGQSAAALKEYVPIPMEVKVDGEVVLDGPLFSGFVLNGRFNAGGVCWDKDARIDDGYFHVVLFEPRNLFSTLITAPSLLSGDWKNAKGVRSFKGKKVEVRSKQEGPRGFPLFEIDGDQPEPQGCQGAVFECLPGAIRLWR